MTIPLIDLTTQYHAIQAEIDAAVSSVLQGGHFILGPNVSALEGEVAAYLGVRHAIGVANGTDALIIALRAAGIGPGDEVIVPAFSFFASAGAVLSAGATPVFADIDPASFNLNPTQAARKITPKTRAILPVHLYGQPAAMVELLQLAKKHGLKVIEDNAQAFGARCGTQLTGSLGEAGCLSFFPTKNFGCYGDGGMIVTQDDQLAETARMLRTHGWKKKYYPEMLGYNSRLDEVQAAILRAKLPHVAAWNQRRREIAARYDQLLAGLPGVVTPPHPADHVFHLYTLRLAKRDAVREALKQAGIASDLYYPQPLHLAAPCRTLGYQKGDFPIAEQACQEALSIPLFPEMSDEQVSAVADVIRRG